MTASLVAFAIAALAVVLMPGVDTILVLRTSLADGSRAGVITAAGIVCGPIVWGALAGIGMMVVFAGAPTVTAVVSAAGGLYLLYLAYGSIVPAVQTWGRAAQVAPHAGGGTGGWFGRGLMTNLLNPKIGVFYLAVMPGLFARDQITVWLGALLGAVHAILGLAFLSCVALLAGVARDRLMRPCASTILQIACGVCLAGFGAYALVEAVIGMRA